MGKGGVGKKQEKEERNGKREDHWKGRHREWVKRRGGRHVARKKR
jgi:hypothetical protein